MDILPRGNKIPSNGPRVESVSLVLVALSTLAVAARLYRRLGMSGSSFGWDDAAISLALVWDPQNHQRLIIDDGFRPLL